MPLGSAYPCMLCTQTIIMQTCPRRALDTPRHAIVQSVVNEADPVTNLEEATTLLDPPVWFQEGERGKKVWQIEPSALAPSCCAHVGVLSRRER